MSLNPSSIQAPTLPLSCPRCETRAAGDWCCWELKDLKARVVRGETMRQLKVAFVGRSAHSIRKTAARWKMGKIAVEGSRRRGCPACGALFVPSSSEHRACDTCRTGQPVEAARVAA